MNRRRRSFASSIRTVGRPARCVPRAPLQHVYSQPYFSDEICPEIEEGRRCWEGAQMRLVRSRKRARDLKRRGVELLDTGERTASGRVVYAWFVEMRHAA